jgi:hypothetical protein
VTSSPGSSMVTVSSTKTFEMSGYSQLIFHIHTWKRMRACKAGQIPRSDTRCLEFQNPPKSVLLSKMSSRLSHVHRIRFLYLNLLMLWLVVSVENGSYLILMENRCKMAIKHWFFDMNGSNLHFFKQEIGHTKIALSFKHFSWMGHYKIDV